MLISHYAIDRYHARWASTLSRDEAAVQLRALTTVAKPIKETSRRKGHELWATGEVKFVITRNTTDRQPLVVTVLPHVPTIDVDEEIRAYRDDEDGGRAAPFAESADARTAYTQAGQDMFIAETLIADAKEMLVDAEKRRREARIQMTRGGAR
jgi:hypothetical protein